MDELFRLSDTRDQDPKVAGWFSDHVDPLRLVVRHWFQRMRDCGADTSEILHDGCPVACVGDAAFGYVNAFTAHAAIGFFHGAALADPGGLLQGKGKRMRHLKLRPGAALDEAAVNRLIREAYDDIRRRLGAASGGMGLGGSGT